MPKRNRSKKNVLKNISDASLKKLIELKKKLLKGGEGEDQSEEKEPSVLNKIAEGFKGLFSGTNTTDANAADANATDTNAADANNTATNAADANAAATNNTANTGATTGGKSRRRNHNNNNKRNNSKRNRKQNSKKRN